MKAEILSYLPGDHPWQNQIHWYDTIESTNTEAKCLAQQGAPHGTVLIADQQTAGRGRMGRSFLSPAGTGIYMSVILRPHCAPAQLMHLTCAVAVAICDAIEKSVGLRPGIKWTNDLVYQSRKLAGILTELSIDPKTGLVDYAVIGIGINCCQQEKAFDPSIRSIAGSLTMITGQTVDRAQIAACMVQSLCKMDTTLLTDQSVVMQQYRKDCITIGRDISLVRSDGIIRHGYALTVDETGALLVCFPDGSIETVNSGEVSVRGMYGYV